VRPAGDVVTFRFDGDAGTLEVLINGLSQGVCWEGYKGKELFPAAAFYGTTPTVTLVRCEAVASFDELVAPSAGAGAASAATADGPVAAPVRAVSGGGGGDDEGAVFDPPSGSRGAGATELQYTGGNATVTSKSGSRTMAVGARGFTTQSYWEFRLDADVAANECTCFGAVTKPISSFDYANEECAMMLRAYNGQLCEWRRSLHASTLSSPLTVHPAALAVATALRRSLPHTPRPQTAGTSDRRHHRGPSDPTPRCWCCSIPPTAR